MNVQTHMSGQISGQVPNQAGSQLPVLSQHNGNALAPQMQNLGGPARAMSNVDPEFSRARRVVQNRICQIIHQQQLSQPMNDRKLRKFVKNLDEDLLKSSRDKDDYMNPETLESRLHNLIKGPPNQCQQYQQAVNSSSPAGTMIPTPGMSHNGNSNMKEMNVQTHMSGQISGQVPNQAGSQLPVLSQHNGNALAPQMQNLGGPARAISNMDPELSRARQIVQNRICQIIQQRPLSQPMNEMKFREIVKKLDEGLLRSSLDKDDYMDPETFERRLHKLIKRRPKQCQQCQQCQHGSCSI